MDAPACARCHAETVSVPVRGEVTLTKTHTDKLKLSTVVYSLRLASVCSQVCLLCSTHCWPDFLSCPRRNGTPREEREQTQTLYAIKSLRAKEAFGFIVLANLLNRSRGGRSLWVQGKVRGHVDSQASLVSRENKANPFVNSPPAAAAAVTHCKEKIFSREWEWRKMRFGRQASVLNLLAWLCANPCGRRPCCDIPYGLLVLFKSCSQSRPEESWGSEEKSDLGARSTRRPRCNLTI